MENQDTLATINFIQIIKALRKSWRFVIKTTLAGLAMGVGLSFLLPEVYTARCTIVPQSGQERTSNLSGLAAMAGISLEMSGGELISPEIYPQVISGVLFLKDLMAKEFRLPDGDAVLLGRYFTDDAYQSRSIGANVFRYTLGLPVVVAEWMRGEPSDDVEVPGGAISAFSPNEYRCVRELSRKISVDYLEKKGCVVISAEMSDPYLAAQLTMHVQQLLQQYVTAFKIEKAQAQWHFVNQRYHEARLDFEEKQRERAHFQDANRGLSTAMARTHEEKLTTEYNLLYSVYSELAKQREQANIAVKEDTPIFTVVEPVTVPMERSSPKRAVICMLFGAMAFVGSLGWRIYRDKQSMIC